MLQYQSLRKGDVGPAEEWTRDFVLSLRAKGLPTYEADTLTFDLTVVHFLQLLSAGDPAIVSATTQHQHALL